VLACALGPLTRADLLTLTRDVPLDSFLLEETLAILQRFVIGDGRQQGYVFAHPRLGNYFYEERLEREERQDTEHRFLAWGQETLTALNSGSKSP
jgi:hypothetical protein